MILVAIVVLLFLQDWRAMILPMIDVPVSLVGTFAVMALLGFSLNNLTLFGMVLAIGIVVDDAIVVLENVERQIANGLEPKAATIKAMGEMTGPIVAITLVLSSVFLPSAFLPGVIGQFFRQFALTISAAMVISAINAMTLTPSRAVAIFSKQKLDEHGQPRARGAALVDLRRSWRASPRWPGCGDTAGRLAGRTRGRDGQDRRRAEVADVRRDEPGLLCRERSAGASWAGKIIGPVNRLLAKVVRRVQPRVRPLTEHYGRAVGRMARVSTLVLLIYGGLLALTVWTSWSRPPRVSSRCRTRATCWSTCNCPIRPPSREPTR